MIFVHGKGGVGKSFVCEKIAENQKKGFNYRCHQITITEDSNLAIFIKFIWPVISVYQDGSLEPDKNDLLGQEALKTIIAKATAELNIINPEKFIENLSVFNLNEVDESILLMVCAKLIASSPFNNLFLLKDVHKLNRETKKYLNLFLRNLSDYGWGGSRFIFEFRDEHELDNEWSLFQKEAFSDLKDLCFDIELTTLTRKEVFEMFHAILAYDDVENITDQFIKKTNGNTLFLVQLMEHFSDAGFLIKNPDTNRFEIDNYWGIAAAIDKIPAVINLFLEFRIENYLSSLSGKERYNIIAYLGISSILNQQVNEDTPVWAINLNKIEIKSIREKLIQDNFLLPSISTPPAIFCHELMQKALSEKLPSYKEFRHSVGRPRRKPELQRSRRCYYWRED